MHATLNCHPILASSSVFITFSLLDAFEHVLLVFLRGLLSTSFSFF